MSESVEWAHAVSSLVRKHPSLSAERFTDDDYQALRLYAHVGMDRIFLTGVDSGRPLIVRYFNGVGFTHNSRLILWESVGRLLPPGKEAQHEMPWFSVGFNLDKWSSHHRYAAILSRAKSTTALREARTGSWSAALDGAVSVGSCDLVVSASSENLRAALQRAVPRSMDLWSESVWGAGGGGSRLRVQVSGHGPVIALASGLTSGDISGALASGTSGFIQFCDAVEKELGLPTASAVPAPFVWAPFTETTADEVNVWLAEKDSSRGKYPSPAIRCPKCGRLEPMTPRSSHGAVDSNYVTAACGVPVYLPFADRPDPDLARRVDSTSRNP